jgi:hypothetical protein
MPNPARDCLFVENPYGVYVFVEITIAINSGPLRGPDRGLESIVNPAGVYANRTIP